MLPLLFVEPKLQNIGQLLTFLNSKIISRCTTSNSLKENYKIYLNVIFLHGFS